MSAAPAADSPVDPRSWDLDNLGGFDMQLDVVSVEFLGERLVLHGTTTNEGGSDRPHYLLLQLVGTLEGEEDYFVQNRHAILGTVPPGATVRWSMPVDEGSAEPWFMVVETLSGRALECETSGDGTPALPEPEPWEDPVEVVALLDSEWARGGDAPGVRLDAEEAATSLGALALAPDDWTIALVGTPTTTPQVLGVQYLSREGNSKVIVAGNLETTAHSPSAVGVSVSLYRYPDYENAISAQAATIREIQPGKTKRWCAFLDVPPSQEFLSSIDRLVVMISGVEETELLAQNMGWDFSLGQMRNEWTSGRAKQAPGLLTNPNVVVVESDTPAAAGASVTWVGVADWKGLRFQNATTEVPTLCGECGHRWSVSHGIANNLAEQQGLGQKLIRGGTRLERLGATFSPGSSGRRIAAGLESERHDEALARAYARVACPSCRDVAHVKLGRV